MSPNIIRVGHFFTIEFRGTQGSSVSRKGGLRAFLEGLSTVSAWHPGITSKLRHQYRRNED